MMPGPLAVFLLAMAAVWLSSEASGLRAILWFSAVGIATWLILHPLTGALLGRIAKARLKEDARLDLMLSSIDAGCREPPFHAEIQRDLMQDSVYQITYVSLFVVKWAAIVVLAGWWAL